MAWRRLLLTTAEHASVTVSSSCSTTRTGRYGTSIRSRKAGDCSNARLPQVASGGQLSRAPGTVRSGPWSLPTHSSWRSIFGTIDLDLRQARLAGPETALEVYNLFGTVTVIVPEGVEVVVRGGGLFASQKIESPERPPIAHGPRLTIDTRGPGGTLHVRTRQTLKQSLKRALKR